MRSRDQQTAVSDVSRVLNIGRHCGYTPAVLHASAESVAAGLSAILPVRTFLLLALGFAFPEVHNAILLAWVSHLPLSQRLDALSELSGFDGRHDDQSHEEETEDLRRERNGCWTFV